MEDLVDLDELILRQLKGINEDASQFTMGLRSNDMSREDQIAFALRLVHLAIAIKRRAGSTPHLVAEGSVIDERTTSGDQLPGQG
jgi:hypothetical protein